jgi:hypothetical protein
MLDWSAFLQLPGSANRNFEVLGRNLIRLNFGSYGEFAALANQPGVEFHLKLHLACPALGAAGAWFGWQCRWFDLPPARALGKNRRNKIEKALRTTERDLPGLTDWVLWTRHPLTAGDQKWFRKLKTKLRLHLYTGEEVEGLLQGSAEMLRATFFGELRITPTVLADQRELALARIRKKWLPDVHQAVAAEREIRRMLGEAEAWRQALDLAKEVEQTHARIEAEPGTDAGALAALKPPFMAFTGDMARLLREVHAALAAGDRDRLAQKLASRPATVPYPLAAYPRGLRGARLACGMGATNTLDDMERALELMGEMETCNKRAFVAVIADAGGGKTHLSAELTSANPRRPAGILFHGGELHHGKTLDDLARSFSVAGRPVPSMVALLAALDAAAQRSGCRLPLVIDGLNEAEDPRDWRPLLAELQVQLGKFPSVMVVVTLRTGARRIETRWPGHTAHQPARQTFVNDALPEDTFQLEIPDFGSDTAQAIEKYLTYYKIRCGEAELPELLSQPLTLRIFCEVANPDRKREVGAEAIPGSLTALFDLFVAKVAQSIVRLVPLAHRYLETDVRDALDHMGLMMWQHKRRAVDEAEWRQAVGDGDRPWNASLVPLLEQEGVILKMKGSGVGKSYLVPTYDAIGGFLIADALLKEHAADLGALAKPEVMDLIDLTKPGHHPLAEDIFTSLVSLVPRRTHRQQFWSLLPEPLRKRALIEAAKLEATYLDAATLAGLSAMLDMDQGWPGTLHQRLFRTRASVNHPLNAEFLGRVLAPLSVANRDLRWTEWVREKSLELHNDGVELTEKWKAKPERTETDKLWARWLTWLLPTTDHHLRNRTTLALYWFGRGDPESLFSLAEEVATLNDPYVFERLMAANYGVAMALHVDPAQRAYREDRLPALARRVFALMFAEGAPARTTHELTREYARRFIELAASRHARLFSAEELKRTRPPFRNGGRIDWAAITSVPADASGESPFRMDFENYTLGRLTSDRNNYDYGHAGYQVVRARVRWRVGDLGWTAARFAAVDREIATERHGFARIDNDHFKVDRYGKKYSLIAYSELKGWMIDGGMELREHHGRTWDVDIDPSFPDQTWQQSVFPEDLLGRDGGSLKEWIARGPVPDLKACARPWKIGNLPGPWVALDGYVNQQDEKRGRRMFGFLRSFLVPEDRAAEFERLLAKQPLGGRWLKDNPRVIYTFAGEAPWCETYPSLPAQPMEFVVREKTVKARRKRACYYLDGKLVHSLPANHVGAVHFALPWMRSMMGNFTEEEIGRMVLRNRFMEVEEVVQKKRAFRVAFPVMEFGWEGRNVFNESVHGASLAKSIARDLGLVHLPQTHDMQTMAGERATVGTRLKYSERVVQTAFFIREDLLRTYLARRRLRLVWAVWGERELSYKQVHRAQEGSDLAGFSHGNYQEVFALPPKDGLQRKVRR